MGEKCIHCGEDCGQHPVVWDEKSFCCHGCKTVYQILNEKKLNKYYEIQPMSGIKIDTADFGEKYAYLDLEEIKNKLLTFSEGGISKVTLFIPTIHCASCIWLLENLSVLNAGIIQSFVNFPKKQVTITFKNELVSLRQIVELLASIHYLPEITFEDLDKKTNKKSNRTLVTKIGIAGFSLLNVMLYNFPSYVPGGELLGPVFTSFFGWMSFLLALPVVFYCASDYYLSAYKSLKHKIVNIDLPITLGIFALFIQSAFEIHTGKGIGYLDSLVGLVFFLLIGKWYQGMTYQALSFERNYKSYFPVAVTKIIDKIQETIPLDKLKEKDHILIRNHELIPADARLVKGNASIDYSFVTGESIPVVKKFGELIYAGGRQVGSVIEIEVIKSVEQSYLTQLWNQDNSKKEEQHRLKKIINLVSEYFTTIIILIAVLAAIYWLIKQPSLALFAFTSVLIISCPCALAMTVPFTFGSTMRAFGRKGFYLKNIDVIENLHQIDAVVFDKTGTITLNQSMKVEFVGKKLTGDQLKMIKSLVYNSSHPLSITIKDFIETDEMEEVKDFIEIPAMGISGLIQGKRINIGSKKFVLGKEDEQPESTNVYVFIDNETLGYFKIENSYRNGLAEVVEKLKKKYKLYLISGDNESERENLKKIFGEETLLLFNQSPQEKMNFVTDLQIKGHKVLMIGDGLNDAGALMASHAGLTIADDIYSFSPACDGIIESSKFSKLSQFINFSKISLNIVKISFIISFLYNLIGISIAVQGTLSPLVAAILMPLSSISVVAFATFSVSLAARKSLK